MIKMPTNHAVYGPKRPVSLRDIDKLGAKPGIVTALHHVYQMVKYWSQKRLSDEKRIMRTSASLGQ